MTLFVEVFETDLGWMALATRGEVAMRLTFGHATATAARQALRLEPGETRAGGPRELVRSLRQYAAGEMVDFCDVPLDFDDSGAFERRVINQCRRIPYGQTLSYGQLAAAAGSLGAARAVGNCMASNRTPLIVPCHRVVYADGRIGPFSAPQGPRMKARLLELETAASAALV